MGLCRLQSYEKKTFRVNGKQYRWVVAAGCRLKALKYRRERMGLAGGLCRIAREVRLYMYRLYNLSDYTMASYVCSLFISLDSSWS